jgi:anti-sigma B factor antagonist
VVDDAAERAELVLTTTRETPSVLVAVAGELDAYSAPALADLVDGLRADGYTNFTLDVSQTTFIDSSGLRLLLALQAEIVQGAVGVLVLRAPSDPMSRLLKITGLTEHFTLG